MAETRGDVIKIRTGRYERRAKKKGGIGKQESGEVWRYGTVEKR